MSELKLSDIWDDATNAVCQAIQESKMCKCKDGECIAAKIEPSAETVRHWNTRAVPDVPELVRYRLNSLGELVYSENGSYVLHSQAAEIIRSMIPRVNNCGRYIAERNDGTLMYLNHGNTWQGCDNFISAKDKEIDWLKNLIDGDDCPDPDKIDALFRRAEAAEAKLAQYEAQEPVGCASVYIYKGRKNIDLNELGNDAAGELPIGDHKLYASPAPAADLKADELPCGHIVLEQSESSGMVHQTVRIEATGFEYIRVVHEEEAYGDGE